MRQGSLDGLCGVYALINSLDLVGLRMRRPELHKELFQQLTCALGAAALLSAMHDGLDALKLQRAAELALGWLSLTYGVTLEVHLPFQGTRFRSTASFLKGVNTYVAMPNTAVIVAFGDQSHLHWTVVRSVEGADLVLRDSDGLTKLRSKGYSVSVSKRCFSPSDTIVVQRTS